MEFNEGIGVEPVLKCYLCNNSGTLLYPSIRDHARGVAGVWNYMRCQECGLVWLDPRPVSSEVKKLYTQDYYTHKSKSTPFDHLKTRLKRIIVRSFSSYSSSLPPGRPWFRMARFAGILPFINELALASTMMLTDSERGRLLDIGCGNGHFLAFMDSLGWDCFGIEPDAEAAHTARNRPGITVATGSFLSSPFPANHFDTVTLSHVIEHVHDPIELLKRSIKFLKPGGKIVISTPNIDSLGHSIFRTFWDNLDHPRHFHLFSASTLRQCMQKTGMEIVSIRSTSRKAHVVWKSGRTQQIKGNQKLWLKSGLGGYHFQWKEYSLTKRFPDQMHGEELFSIGRKHAS